MSATTPVHYLYNLVVVEVPRSINKAAIMEGARRNENLRTIRITITDIVHAHTALDYSNNMFYKY